ncbi:MAG TPA: hypothetical protein VHY91_23490 [Pirellulales bacterium]|jgi:hypothetical protein|nr:hypothetical protein [Pirellulales bacterium]
MSDPARLPGAGPATFVDATSQPSEAPARYPAIRVCGDCTACCTVMGVVELGKANYQRCLHECGRCTIYEARPSVCRTWSCGWLLGAIEGDERRRPDRLGLMFNSEHLAGKPVTVAYEVWPGAGRQPNSKYLLGKMSQAAPIILRAYETRKCDVITPDPATRESFRQLILQEWVQKPGADWAECGYFD